MDKRSLTERDICTKFILPAVKRAGWDEMLQVREEVYFTKGRIIVRGKLVTRGKAKKADFVLYYKPNIPIALIEAKDNNHSIGDGIQQGLDYAATLDIPFVFASNGDGFVFHDRTGQSNPTEANLGLDAFPSPAALWARYRAYGRVMLRNPPKVIVPEDRLSDFKCLSGDLPITRTGSIGTMAIFSGDYVAIPSAYLIRMRFSKSVDARYMHLSLRSPSGQAALGLGTTRVAQPNINAKTLAAIPIPLPPLAEQHRIVAKVDALMALCDRLEASLAASADTRRRLLDALLAEALAPAEDRELEAAEWR